MTTKKNLWGEVSLTQTRRNPYTILKEQASILGEITNGLLVGEVTQLPRPITEAQFPDMYGQKAVLGKSLISDQEEGRLYASLRIVAPALNHYKYSVIQINYPIEFYPLMLIDLANDEAVHRCPNEESFEQVLQQVLRSNKVKDVIEALLSQVQ